MLDSKTIEIVQSTVPVLKERGEDITKAFYGVLFSRYPQVQPMFDMEKQKTGQQPRALAMAILNGAQNISNLDAIKKSLSSCGRVPFSCHSGSFRRCSNTRNTYCMGKSIWCSC